VYTYTYDLVGNRTDVWQDGLPLEHHDYDAANQVVGWTYDAAGNLINDGTNQYTYDALNRTSSVRQGGTTTTSSYNGDGTLVAQTANGVATLYTQDLASPLSQILQTKVGSATATDYVYGVNRLASLSGSTTTWYAADALGSVRRTFNTAATPLGIVNYDPWGTPESGTVPMFGFTGELQDTATGLVNLRARWYSTSQGKFTTVDPYAGDPAQPYSLHPYESFRWQTSAGDDTVPYSLHPYAYVLSNPVNLIDPAGTCAVTEEGEDCRRPQHDPRDLTDWLYREMKQNLDDPRLKVVKDLNSNSILPTGTVRFGPFGLVCTFNAGSILPAPIAQLLARDQFNELVADRKPWDFKHKILERLGAGITLCSNVGCQSDLEYSVPGNIHFGFVAREAGYSESMIKLGAGNAEKDDPAHTYDPSDPRYTPYTGETHLSFGPDLNLGDDPVDNWAVTFGIRLYNKYGRSLTRATLKLELATALPGVAKHQPDANPVDERIARKWPYPVGYFDPTKP